MSLKRRMVFTVLCKIVNVCMYASRFDKLTRNLSPGLLTNWPPNSTCKEINFYWFIESISWRKIIFTAKIHGHNPTPNNTTFLAFKVCIVYRYCDGHWPVFQCVCMYVWMATAVCSYISVYMVDSQSSIMSSHQITGDAVHLILLLLCVLLQNHSNFTRQQ